MYHVAESNQQAAVAKSCAYQNAKIDRGPFNSILDSSSNQLDYVEVL